MEYNPVLPFRNAHFNTIYRKAFTNPVVEFSRKRLITPDNDFLDLDFSKVNSNIIIIIVHGLEGSSKSKYVLSNTKYFNRSGYDVCAMNMRGCSGEPNSLYSSYHSGKTDDLSLIIDEISGQYEDIYLLGYSLGGNIVLKYTGENSGVLNNKIRKSIGISVPVDLKSAAVELAKKKNYIYNYMFMKEMKEKLRSRVKKFGVDISLEEINRIKNFNEFDNIYTSVAHGFKDAKDYWKKNSSKQFLEHIKIPALLLNAADDTFLGENCYPFAEAKNNRFLILEVPKYGGHVGFNVSFKPEKNHWLEKRILNFIENE